MESFVSSSHFKILDHYCDNHKNLQLNLLKSYWVCFWFKAGKQFKLPQRFGSLFHNQYDFIVYIYPYIPLLLLCSKVMCSIHIPIHPLFLERSATYNLSCLLLHEAVICKYLVLKSIVSNKWWWVDCKFEDTN